MKLTTQESRLVERLRKQERQWPRLRWFVLGSGIFGTMAASYIVLTLLKHLDDVLLGKDDFVSRAWLFGWTKFWPESLMMFGVAVVLIFWSIRDWRGNANRVLLLKLLDVQQEEKT